MPSIYEAAGGEAGLLRLAEAWHARVTADEIVGHAFSHGVHPDHTLRLAAYWIEALGGPPTYSERYGDETSVVRLHSGHGVHDEMDRRAIACFDQALIDTGMSTDEPLRRALHDYFAWATTASMARYHQSSDDVPENLSVPRWSWGGLQPRLVVRDATVADVPAIAAIGSVGFSAVHNDIVGPTFAAEVVEQTYSVAALTECVIRCGEADDAAFLVAEDTGDVVGYLHYDSVGAEPELHRIYVDLERKRGGIGSALMRELHARLRPGSSYVLLVAEANTDARAFYERHGLTVERRIDGPGYYRDTMSIQVDEAPPAAQADLMRFTKPAG